MRHNNNCNYLEIGVSNPQCNFDFINTVNKTGIDPGLELSNHTTEFKVTSDEFFEKLHTNETRFPNNYKWDIIFIDGLHLAHQVYKDFCNALQHITTNGYIVLHDCSPPDFMHAHSDHEHYINYRHNWNGTVWKTLYYLRTALDCKIFTIDSDWGVGIISVGENGARIPHSNPFFDFGQMKHHRQEHLGLISVDEFRAMY